MDENELERRREILRDELETATILLPTMPQHDVLLLTAAAKRASDGARSAAFAEAAERRKRTTRT